MNKQASFLNGTDMDVIKRYMLGGAGIGAGAGTITALLNYINGMKRDADNGPSLDDDTLYINVDGQKQKKPEVPGQTKMANAEDPSIFRGGLAMTGGVLTAAAAYQTVRSLFQELQRRQVQGELDSAQQLHTGTIQREADAIKSVKRRKQPAFSAGVSSYGDSLSKLASEVGVNPGGGSMSFGEKLVSLPTAATLLMAVASGVVANSALRKAFPAPVTGPSKLVPRRVVIRDADTDPDDSPVDGGKEPDMDQLPDKYASERDWLDATEFLLDMTSQWNKEAALDSDLNDLVSAVADGRYNDIIGKMVERGPFASLDFVKGASKKNCGPENRTIAVGLLARSQALKHVAGMLAAVEYTQYAPTFTKMAAALPPALQGSLVSMLACMRRAGRYDIMEKVAASIEDGAGTKVAFMGEVGEDLILEKLLQQSLSGGEDHTGSAVSGKEDNSQEAVNPGVATLVGSGEGESSQEGAESEGVKDVDVNGPAASEFANQNGDVIDQLLSGKDSTKPYLVQDPGK